MGYKYKLQMILICWTTCSTCGCRHASITSGVLICLNRFPVPVDVGTMLSCGRPHNYRQLRTSSQDKVQFIQILHNLRSCDHRRWKFAGMSNARQSQKDTKLQPAPWISGCHPPDPANSCDFLILRTHNLQKLLQDPTAAPQPQASTYSYQVSRATLQHLRWKSHGTAMLTATFTAFSFLCVWCLTLGMLLGTPVARTGVVALGPWSCMLAALATITDASSCKNKKRLIFVSAASAL